MITCVFEDGHQFRFRHATVGIIAVRDNNILLIKRSLESHTEAGKWGLPGGYVDPGETTSQAAEREFQEETGYEGKTIKLFQIIDNPRRMNEDKQNIEFTYIVDCGEKTGKSDREISSLEWFPLETPPGKDAMAFDHGETIELYKSYLEKPFPLPLIKSADIDMGSG